jgi:hypothetical protein
MMVQEARESLWRAITKRLSTTYDGEGFDVNVEVRNERELDVWITPYSSVRTRTLHPEPFELGADQNEFAEQIVEQLAAEEPGSKSCS